MPEWIHNRAEHLLAKNPDMSKSTAFAVATQQSHAMGKTPKSYGTKAGRVEAKKKYDTPKGDVHKANPGNLDSPKLAAMLRGFVTEIGCMAIEDMAKEAMTPELQRMLVGGGIGAGLGAGAGYLGGKAMEPLPTPGEEEKNYGLRGALLGAGVGALGGAGLGYLAKPKAVAELAQAAPPAAPPKSLEETIHSATEGAGWLPNEVTPRVRMVETPQGAMNELNQMMNVADYQEALEGMKREGKLRGPSLRARVEAAQGEKVKPRHLRGYLASRGQAIREQLARQHGVLDVDEAALGKYGHVKQAGIAVQYDGNCNPVSAETSEEWLAAHFKKMGAFKVPERLLDAEVAFQQSKYAEEISREEAAKSLDRLESLEKQKPTAGKIMRYAGIGAVAAPAINIARNVVSGGRHWSGASKDALKAMGGARASSRALASHAIGGAATSGLIPLMRHQMDRHAEMSRLKEYVAQHEGKAKEGSFATSEYSTPIEGPKRLHQASYLPHAKMAGIGPESGMSTSEYSGPLSYGRFPMASYQPGFRAPNLRAKPFENPWQQIYEGEMKVGAVMSPSEVGSPKAQLGSSMKVGKPKTTAPPGPSIQQVAKPEGFGQPIAGAKKTTI